MKKKAIIFDDMRKATTKFYADCMVKTKRNEVNRFKIPQSVLDAEMLDGLEALQQFVEFCEVRGFKCYFGNAVGIILVGRA